MSDIVLRPVTLADTPFLNEVMNDSAVLDAMNEAPTRPEDWADAIREWLKDADEEDYVITVDGTPVGWLGVNNLMDPGGVVWLKTIAILPGCQQRGIGREAIRRMIDALRARGYRRAALYTDVLNARARACYSRCGFVVTDTFAGEMPNGKTVERCRMELILIPERGG